MTGVMHGVDQRTRLVGRNRLELLLFRLGGRQRFGINVFKVREVIRCPALTRIPQSHPVVRGVANMRGMTITVMDLGMALGGRPLEANEDCFVVITEFNRYVQGFLVSGVDRIVNMNWEAILPPPSGTGRQSYMTAVTSVDDELVEIIDVEKVLAEVTGEHLEMSEDVLDSAAQDSAERPARVLVVDDSMVARKQITVTLDRLGAEHEIAKNGREALDRLRQLEAEGVDLPRHFAVVICDVEMPEMDGYTLTKLIKEDPAMRGLYVVLHTSLSGVFNEAMVEKVGADLFVPKFNADDLGKAVLQYVHKSSAAASVRAA